MAWEYANDTSVASTAKGLTDVGLTAGNIASADYLRITCTGADVRWRDDGTVPTATYGHIFQEDVTYEAKPTEMDYSKLELIVVSGTANVTVSIRYPS